MILGGDTKEYAIGRHNAQLAGPNVPLTTVVENVHISGIEEA